MAAPLVTENESSVDYTFIHMNVLCSDYTRKHLRSAAEMRSVFTAARALAPHTRGVSVIMQHAHTFCLGWPFEPTDPPRLLDQGRMKQLPPVMIVNGLYDPATAVNWATMMREEVPTEFNVWLNSGGHAAYQYFGDANKAINAFLVNGTIPFDGTIYQS